MNKNRVTTFKRQVGITTATLLVVANMIGSGIFTTTGFLVRDLGSPTAIIFAWVLGAVFALSGALSYGQLTAHMPENGGEYFLLSEIFHPALGFVAGILSFVVGFSAPIAAASISFGSYFAAVVPGTSPVVPAAFIVVALSLVHALNIRLGSGVQNVFTVAKIALIIFFSVAGFMCIENSEFFQAQARPFVQMVFSPAFAVGIIFISFSYSGWNGAAYLAGEIKNPSKTLPAALCTGTLIVAVLYITINVLFLSAVPMQKLSGVLEVGHVVATKLFGATAGKLFSGLISLALVSSISAMIMTGPRVYEVMGRDFRALSFLNYRLKSGGPITAIVLQALVVLVMILTLSFDSLLTYIGFTLSLCTAFTVLGLFIVRKDLTNKSRWGYPLLPLVFIVISLWIITHAIWNRPVESLSGFATIGVGLVLYVFLRKSRVR